MTGGILGYMTQLYRCPKCGAEQRTGTSGAVPRFMTCMKCFSTMDLVPNSAQVETVE